MFDFQYFGFSSRRKQCCGTVMIYYAFGSGSGSYFGNVLVSVPVPVQVPDPDPGFFSTVFRQHKFVQYLCLFNVRSSNVCQKGDLYFILYFLTFVIHFMLESEPEPECIKVPVLRYGKKLRFLRFLFRFLDTVRKTTAIFILQINDSAFVVLRD
jgi:hypothetical protein